MLPVEFSVANMLLLLATVILTILFFTVLLKLSPPGTRRKPRSLGIFTTGTKRKRAQLVTLPRVRKDSAKNNCIHYVGYLSKLSRNKPIPDECFGCEKIVDCMMKG